MSGCVENHPRCPNCAEQHLKHHDQRHGKFWCSGRPDDAEQPELAFLDPGCDLQSPSGLNKLLFRSYAVEQDCGFAHTEIAGTLVPQNSRFYIAPRPAKMRLLEEMWIIALA
jgi:hypothetical protein